VEINLKYFKSAVSTLRKCHISFVQVDIQDGELMALLEDAPVWGLPPLRPRLSRLLPRTRQSERVRATMMTRQREGDQQRDQAQVCTFLKYQKI
jgi:hypothetical protein